MSNAVGDTEIVARFAVGGSIIAQTAVTVWRVILQSGSTSVAPNSYVYITADPQMPVLKASLNPPSMNGNVNWNLLMEYMRPNRNDSNTLASNVVASGIWNVDFGGNFYGGKFTLKATYEGLTSNVFVFYVRGT